MTDNTQHLTEGGSVDSGIVVAQNASWPGGARSATASSIRSTAGAGDAAARANAGVGTGAGVGAGAAGGVVLRESSWTVARGEAVVWCVPHRKHRAELLALGAGVLRPTNGSIHFASAQVALVPAELTTEVRIKADRLIGLRARLRGVAPVMAVQQVTEILDRLGFIGDVAGSLRIMSALNRFLVMLADALAAEPDLLVVDAYWDTFSAAEHAAVGEVIAEFCAGGGTVICGAPDSSTAPPWAADWPHRHLADGTLQ